MIGTRFLHFLSWPALVAMLVVPGAAVAEPTVRIGRQQIVGVAQSDGIASFRGIAYARPPVGELRWKAPQRPLSRTGRIDATRFAPACAQGEGNTLWYRNVAQAMGADPASVPAIERVSEDCLYLNVWTPDPQQRSARQGLPVMVWIHGGSNENGYAHEPNYHGSELAKQGVVVVSFNYRVGLLGFFAHPALGKDGSGQQGLLDQIAALQWVKANISSFGGDPRQVTVFGESAGGTDIAALAGMPQAKGTFARAIIQSGFLPRTAVTSRGEARGFAAALFDPKVTAAALRAMTWNEIISLQHRKLRGHFYTPVAEWPQRMPVPLLIGSNADEHLMYLPKDDAGLAAELAKELDGLPKAQLAQIEAMLNQLPGSFANRVDAVSASNAFHCPSARLADATAARGNPVFVYRFERVRPGKHGLGAYHGAEIPYAFGTDDPWMPAADTDRSLARTMQTYWVNFARTGDPNGSGLPAWPRWEGAAPWVLGLGDLVAAKAMPLAAFCGALSAPE